MLSKCSCVCLITLYTTGLDSGSCGLNKNPRFMLPVIRRYFGTELQRKNMFSSSDKLDLIISGLCFNFDFESPRSCSNKRIVGTTSIKRPLLNFGKWGLRRFILNMFPDVPNKPSAWRYEHGHCSHTYFIGSVLERNITICCDMSSEIVSDLPMNFLEICHVHERQAIVHSAGSYLSRIDKIFNQQPQLWTSSSLWTTPSLQISSGQLMPTNWQGRRRNGDRWDKMSVKGVTLDWYERCRVKTRL